MKHKIIKLSLLVLIMNVLTSSKESICVNPAKDSLKSKDTCVQAKKAAGENKTATQTAVVKEKANDNANAPLADYKMPVIPFSRFIL